MDKDQKESDIEKYNERRRKWYDRSGGKGERGEKERKILRQAHQMNATMFFNLHIFGFFRKQKQLRWAPIHANCKGII